MTYSRKLRQRSGLYNCYHVLLWYIVFITLGLIDIVPVVKFATQRVRKTWNKVNNKDRFAILEVRHAYQTNPSFGNDRFAFSAMVVKRQWSFPTPQIAKFMGSTWAPCWPHEPCYQGSIDGYIIFMTTSCRPIRSHIWIFLLTWYGFILGNTILTALYKTAALMIDILGSILISPCIKHTWPNNWFLLDVMLIYTAWRRNICWNYRLFDTL